MTQRSLSNSPKNPRSCPRCQFTALTLSACFLSALVVLMEGCGSSTAIKSTTINVSVQEFESRAGVAQSISRTISDRFAALLRRTGRFVVVDRKQILTNAHEEADPKSTVEGQNDVDETKILPNRKLIYGSVGKMGNESYLISVKMIDVETSNVDVALSKVYSGNLEVLSNEFLAAYVNELVNAVERAKSN